MHREMEIVIDDLLVIAKDVVFLPHFYLSCKSGTSQAEIYLHGLDACLNYFFCALSFFSF